LNDLISRCAAFFALLLPIRYDQNRLNAITANLMQTGDTFMGAVYSCSSEERKNETIITLCKLRNICRRLHLTCEKSNTSGQIDKMPSDMKRLHLLQRKNDSAKGS
jgi:hypothetical protein